MKVISNDEDLIKKILSGDRSMINNAEKSIFCYKCDNFYDKTSESGIIYNDATLNIDWHLPQEDLIVSEKDLELPTFKEVTQ